MACHLADHEPHALVRIPHDEAFDLSLILARGRGCASVLAPELTYDLAVAGQVLLAADVFRDHLVSAGLLEEVLQTTLVATEALGNNCPRPEVADELEQAARQLSERLAKADHEAAERFALGALAPRIHPPASPELDRSLGAALAVLSAPPLLLVPPEVTSVELIEGRTVVSLVRELTRIGSELPMLERGLQANLSWLEFNLRPLPVVAEATLDELAERVVELQLAKLASRHLGELLGGCSDESVAAWARSTSQGLVARLERLAGNLTTVLELLD